MDKEQLRKIIYIVVSIIVAILAVKLFIWLLPIILIAILALFIYNSMRKNEKENINTKKGKSKKTIIIDSEDND